MSSSQPDFSNMESISFTEMWVSEMSFIQQNNANGGIEIYVLSRKNGHPIGGVDLEVYQDRNYSSNLGKVGNVEKE